MGNYWSEPSNCASLEDNVPAVTSYLYEITTENYRDIIAKHEVVLLYFYTSTICTEEHPTFEATAKRIHELYPNGNVLVGRINAEREPYLAKNKKRNFNVKCFPFVKLFYMGKPKHGDYRGRRTVDKFVQLIADLLENPKLRVDIIQWN